MAKRDYLDHLAQVPLFANCTRKDLQRIAKAGTEIPFRAGETLVDQGQAGKECFVIVAGTATVRRNGQKVATLGPGATVGELSLLDHGPRTATVVADTDMTVFVLDQRSFLAAIDDVPTLAHRLLASLASRIRELDRATFG